MILSVRAELTKITRQRGLLFCGFLLVPAFTMIVGFALNSFVVPDARTGGAIPFIHSATRSLRVAGNPVAQLFYALGAAGIFAVDYRYSGWRQVVPRAGRMRPLGAKIVAFAALAGISLTLVIAGEVLSLLVAVLARGAIAVPTDWSGAGAASLCGSFAVSFVELLALAAVVAAVATLTRSLMAATILPFLIGLTASSAQAYAGSSIAKVPLPTLAADGLRAGLDTGWSMSLAWSAIVLIGWCAMGFGATVLIFWRQDLVSE